MAVKLLDDQGNPVEDSQDSLEQNKATPTISKEEEKKESIKDEPKPPIRNAAYEAVIADQQKTMKKMQDDFDARMAKLEAGPPEDPKDLDKKLWETPHQSIQKIVDESLQRTIAPLLEQVKEGPVSTKLDKIKSRLRDENPAYAEVLDKAGVHIDTVINASGQEPSYETVRMAIIGVRGAAAMGMLDGVDFGTAVSKEPNPDLTKQDDNDMTIPPHLRPSAPKAPRKKEANKITMDDLTENERRLCREQNMTASDYIAMRNATALEVTSIELPSEKKE